MPVEVGDQLPLALRLGVALVLGAAVGLERELQRQTAGFRTHALVALGASLFTVVSFSFPGVGDGSRIAAQIVTGVGFLGAGAILRGDQGRIRGLTTAASLWAVAAVGMATGAGMFVLAAVGTALVIFALELLDRFEGVLMRRIEAAGSRRRAEGRDDD